MALFSNIKRAFGFGDDDDEVEYAAEATTVDTEAAAPESAPESSDEFTPDPLLTAEIFDDVIRVFNDFQPDFIKECLNTEAQRKYVLNSLDAGLRKRIDDTLRLAYESGSKRWESERRTMSDEMGRLKEQYARLEENKKEFKTAQLSAQRQKRALNERVHDLELQVTSLEAEKEQYELENRSMLNKLRVAGVTGQAPEGVNSELEDRLKQLEEENSKLKADNTALNTRVGELTAETADLEEIHQYIERFESLKKKKDNKIAELNAAAKRQASHFEQVETEYKTRIENLDKEIERLRKELDHNQYVHAEAEDALRKQIENLTDGAAKDASAAEAETAQPAKKRKPRKAKQPAISAIDELIDSADWLLAPAPEQTKPAEEKDDDFGYKAPMRKSPPAAEGQLSLW